MAFLLRFDVHLMQLDLRFKGKAVLTPLKPVEQHPLQIERLLNFLDLSGLFISYMQALRETILWQKKA